MGVCSRHCCDRYECSQLSLTKDIESHFLQVKKTTAVDKRAKAAKFIHPIFAVLDRDDYERIHASFQSSSSTNISSVNMLNECNMFVELRERGRGDNKRYLEIEMTLNGFRYPWILEHFHGSRWIPTSFHEYLCMPTEGVGGRGSRGGPR